MKIASLAAALVVTALPVVSLAQSAPAAESVKADEQIILKQVMTDKRAVYAQNLQLTDAESRAFWPVYDEYEIKAKKLNDEFLALVDDYAAKFGSISDADATEMLKTKMRIEKEREDLKQAYTKKVAKALPPVKALRYAQIETRLDNMLRREVYGLIPLAQ
jgi:Spy/CpxP family protein refolding chaperone